MIDRVQTDDQVGAAIRDSGVPRGELFITTKFWPHWGSPENVGKCLDACLKSMGLEYIDLYLAHWPLVLQPLPDLSKAKASHDATDAERGIATDSHGHIIKDWQYTCKTIAAAHHETGSFHPTWRAMQDLVTTGKVRAIGVSNFNIQQLQEILSLEGSIPLSCNQVESHPRFANSKLFDFMDRNGILKVAYCPFAGQDHDGSPLVEDPKVKELAAKNSMGIGQLLQSWAVQRDTIPIGKSQTLGRLKYPNVVELSELTSQCRANCKQPCYSPSSRTGF